MRWSIYHERQAGNHPCDTEIWVVSDEESISLQEVRSLDLALRVHNPRYSWAGKETLGMLLGKVVKLGEVTWVAAESYPVLTGRIDALIWRRLWNRPVRLLFLFLLTPAWLWAKQ